MRFMSGDTDDVILHQEPQEGVRFVQKRSGARRCSARCATRSTTAADPPRLVRARRLRVRPWSTRVAASLGARDVRGTAARSPWHAHCEVMRMTTRPTPRCSAAAFALSLTAAVLASGCECDVPPTSSPIVHERDHDSPSEERESRDHDDERDDESTTRGVESRRREAREDGTQEATEWLSDFARE